jgi:glycine hydroxymethyltransferase
VILGDPVNQPSDLHTVKTPRFSNCTDIEEQGTGMSIDRDKKLIVDLLTRLSGQERRAHRSISMTPSENVLSPLARLPFVLDAYSRYFLDDLRLFGRWFFHGGKEIGSIEQEVLLPLFRTMARARHVNVRPISGLNCMTVVLAGLTNPGDVVFTVPLEAGGHASTPVVAGRFGLQVRPIPFSNPFDIDMNRLETELAQLRPAVLYIDQSTLLFPIDPLPLRKLIDAVSSETVLHYDSSHVNGLILGGAIFNPLERGAHCFGGSTHKTLPGPHKGFFATNDDTLSLQIQEMSDHFVSHHHLAEVISLTVTLIEMQLCGGNHYARRVIANARNFARVLSERGVFVAAADRGFTASHQVWAIPGTKYSMDELAERLYRCGIIVNNFNGLPGIAQPAFRLSLAEATRMGATELDAANLAGIFADALGGEVQETSLQQRVDQLCRKLNRPHYCFELDKLRLLGVPNELKALLEALFAPA